MSTLAEDMAQLREEFSALHRTASRIMRKLGMEPMNADPSVAVDIIKGVVCDHYGLPVTVMGTKMRTDQFVRPRHVAIYLTRELMPNLSLVEIATHFRKTMDHGTVMHACNAVAARLKTEPEFTAVLETLRARCVEKIENQTMPLFAAAS